MKVFKDIFKHPNKYIISSVFCFLYAVISIILHNLNNYNVYNKSVVVLSQITILIYSVILLWKSTMPSPPQEYKKEIKPDFFDRIIGFYTCFLGYFSSFALITPFMLVIDSEMSNDMSIILFLFVIAMSSFLGTTMIKKGKKILCGKAVATESQPPSNNDSDEYVSEFINDRSFKNVSNAIPSDAKSVQSDNIVTTVSQKSKLTYMSDVDKEKLRQWRISKGYISQIDEIVSKPPLVNYQSHSTNNQKLELLISTEQLNNLKACIMLPKLYINFCSLKKGEIAVYHCTAWQLDDFGKEKYFGNLLITTQRFVFISVERGFDVNHKDIIGVSGTNNCLIIYSKFNTYRLHTIHTELAELTFNAIRHNSLPIEGHLTVSAQISHSVLDYYSYDDDIDEDDISCVDGMDGHDFEYWCADLLKRCDFDDVTVTRASGDQGVDIIAVKDDVKYAIQCKNYYSTLGNKPIQEICAGKMFYDCDVAVVMTNSYFTPHAIELAKKTNVRLWDREKLQDMMDDAY